MGPFLDQGGICWAKSMVPIMSLSRPGSGLVGWLDHCGRNTYILDMYMQTKGEVSCIFTVCVGLIAPVLPRKLDSNWQRYTVRELSPLCVALDAVGRWVLRSRP